MRFLFVFSIGCLTVALVEHGLKFAPFFYEKFFSHKENVISDKTLSTKIYSMIDWLRGEYYKASCSQGVDNEKYAFDSYEFI